MEPAFRLCVELAFSTCGVNSAEAEVSPVYFNVGI